MLQNKQKPDPYFELVKNEGRYNEKIIDISADKYRLNRRKVRLIRTRGRNTFRIRPRVKKIITHCNC